MPDIISIKTLESIQTLSTMIEEPLSYKIDVIRIFKEDLHHIKLNSLCPENTWDLLEGAILGKGDPNSLNFPCCSGDTKLSDLTFKVVNDTLNREFKLKNHWTNAGKNLGFKMEEGLELRKILGLSLTQEVKYLISDDKSLPPIPSEDNDSLTSVSILEVNDSLTSVSILEDNDSLTSVSILENETTNE